MENCSMPEIYKGPVSRAFWIASLGLPGLLVDLLSKTVWNVHDKLTMLEMRLSDTTDHKEVKSLQSQIDELAIMNSNGKRVLNLTLSDFELAFHQTRGIEHVDIQNPFTELLGSRSGLEGQAEPKFHLNTERKPQMIKKKKLAGAV
jgi:hypothetical protein